MRKKSHEEKLERGLEELQKLGIAADEVSLADIDRLSAHLGKGKETDLALIFLLGRIADSASAQVLSSLEQKAGDKEIKREIRRSLYRLAQKGIMAPSRAEAENRARKSILDLGPNIEGYLSSVDGGGGRLVWLVKPQAGSGIRLLQGMVSDREGLAQVGGAQVRRKELRNMMQEIKERHGVSMIPVPWEYCDLILYEGYEKARALGRTGLDAYASLRPLFSATKPVSLQHPIYSRLESGESRSGAWRELSRRLLDEVEFRTWLLDEDWMKGYVEQVQEAQESRLVLNEVQKEERFAGIVRDAVRELFSGERGGIFQRRMEDMALYFLETKREELAKLALAVALQLAEGDLGWLDISFLTGLVQKSLAFYLSQAKENAAEQTSLIVKA